ncbi:MAG: GNAT family N-acetyltransferase [Clostridia bacterium]|nr:GNAT family N-acetyltransferase [Clostridia bacterium]
MDFTLKHFSELSNTELYEILKTRQEVFVVEQNCPYMDIDDADKDALHVFSWNDSGRINACLRVFYKDKAAGIVQIGRVVTLDRGIGLGGQILHKGVEIALEQFNAKKIYLEAQTYAVGFYEKEGFKVISEPFLEDGIPHVRMERIT